MISAVTRNSPVDYLARAIVLTGVTVPNFIIGIVVLYILLSRFHYTPPLQFAAFRVDPSSNLQQFVRPVAILAVSPTASIARLTRSQMLEVMGEDYVRTARAKGLGGGTVLRRHVLRNALPPIFGLLASIVGLLLSGTVIVEVLFSLPGIGSALLLGVQNRDYPLVQGIVLLLGVAFILISSVLDVSIAWIDPRTRNA